MTVDVAALRRTATRCETAQTQAERVAGRLRRTAASLAQQWQGDAAVAALQELEQLARRMTQQAATHAHAAGVLTTCAHVVEEAQADSARAAALEAQDDERRGRAAARGAFVSPHDDTGAQRYARALAADAHARAEQACTRAAADLRGLAPAHQDLSPADQLVGVGRGAVDAVRGTADLLVDLLRDPRGTAGGLVEGLDHARRHPREAATAAAGWDVLQAGRYGEWAGGFVPDLLTGVLSGGAVPAGRRAADLADELRELADDVADLERFDGRAVPTYSPVPGGHVRPQARAPMTPRYPRVIKVLTPERQRHILDGDPPPRTGGGHRAGTNRPGKSEFPPGWSDDEIIRRVMVTARHPRATHEQDGRQTLKAEASYDGVRIEVIVGRDGRIVTAYPLEGPGVVKNAHSRRASAL